MAHKYKYNLNISDSNISKDKTISIWHYIILARFIILQYFEKSGNEKFLIKTFEFSVKEIMSNYGPKETSKFIIRFIEDILLKKKLVSVKEWEEYVKLLAKVASKYAVKNWIISHNEYKTRFYDQLLIFISSFVFDSEQKEDIEGIIEDFK